MMGELIERAYFVFCLGVGWLIRSAKYSTARIVHQDGRLQVRKYRLPYAPFLIWLGRPLMRFLDTGVRVLPQREWLDREREVYRRICGTSVRASDDGELILPHLAGETLAALLQNPELLESVRRKAIDGAVVALAGFHDLGLTHADAMADNVMVDLKAGVARWFDFETIHDPARPLAWRRGDDLRALLVTCLARTVPERRAGTLRRILDVYGDEDVIRVLSASFTQVVRRPLAFHLAQASLSFQTYRKIDQLLRERHPHHERVS